MFTRYSGRAWEERFLPRLSSAQVNTLQKDDALVILPLGAVEQHGPHMPVMTDALIGEALLTRTMDLLPLNSNIWILPPIAYGKSNEHIGFAGTISLSAATLQNVVLDIAHSLKSSGFRRLLLLNTHGGNQDLLNVAAREIRIQTDLMVFYISPGGLDAANEFLTEEEQELGIHAGDAETSLLLAIKPNWVHDHSQLSEMPDLSEYEFLTLEGKVRFAWVMADISESGIAGNASLATAEKGEMILERSAGILARALQEISKFEITNVRMKKANPV